MRFSLTRHQRDDGVVTLAPVGKADMCTVSARRAAMQDTPSTPHASTWSSWRRS
jgi:hypothetical protein